VGGLRLQKFLAKHGPGCSRRRAEEAIARGEVLVDGEVAGIGTCLQNAQQIIVWNGQRVLADGRDHRTVLALNKPIGYVCTHRDPHWHDDKTIFSLLPSHHSRMICCGRLDRDSEGLILLTDDGQLANRLMHPSHGVAKFYHVAIDRPLHRGHLQKCLAGILDGDDLLHMDALQAHGGDWRMLDVQLGGGKKRHIRRMLTALGYQITALRRYRIGNFFLANLRPGHCKTLGEKELIQLLSPVAQPNAEKMASAANSSTVRIPRRQ
jgi:23S rRNA pseudouridine2605 synthase